MARKPEPNTDDAAIPGTGPASDAMPDAGVAEAPANAGAEPNTTVATVGDAGAEWAAPAIQDLAGLPIALHEDAIRAWLDSPAGQAWLLARQSAPSAPLPLPPVDPEADDPKQAFPRVRAAFAVGIRAADVLDFRADGDRVVVVTRDGRKLVGGAE